MSDEREQIELSDTGKDVVLKMSDGNPGAIRVMADILNKYEQEGLMFLLDLDDMNIRGSQIWIGFNDYCNEDLGKFVACIKDRDRSMVNEINRVGKSGNHNHRAVVGGASAPGKRELLY